MEPEPERVDLSPLDPSRDKIKWQTSSARIATRAAELRMLRRKVVRRAAIAVALSMAAGITLYFTAPRNHPQRQHTDVLDWATSDHVDPYELFELGGNHAQ